MGATVEFCGEEYPASRDRALTIGRVGRRRDRRQPLPAPDLPPATVEHGCGGCQRRLDAHGHRRRQEGPVPGLAARPARGSRSRWRRSSCGSRPGRRPTTSTSLTDTPFVSVETAGRARGRGRRRRDHGRPRVDDPRPEAPRRRAVRGLPAQLVCRHGPDPVVGRRRRAARLDGHQVQPQARQRLPEARRCGHPRPARRRRASSRATARPASSSTRCRPGWSPRTTSPCSTEPAHARAAPARQTVASTGIGECSRPRRPPRPRPRLGWSLRPG